MSETPWQTLLEVEVALAEALAVAGMIPATSVDAIRRAARVDRFDLTVLATDAVDAGNPVIPLVRHLTRLVAQEDAAAAGHVHWGATSQDVMDTALVLQLRTDTAVVLAALRRGADAAASLAERHAATPMAGRTWLQQATPTTFGARALVWMESLDRAHARIETALASACVLQLGGATGTLSSLGDRGPAVAQALADRLGLGVALVAWHTERSRVADLACALGLACGALGKVARDIGLMAQTEVREAAEPSAPGRGGSSAMPHKQNPVLSARALAAAVRAPGLVATMLAAMPQEYERSLGGWQAEWDTVPTLVEVTSEAADAMAEALAGLRVDEARMRANLDLAGGVARAEGLVAALAPRIGRDAAVRVVEQACREAIVSGRSLAAVAAADTSIGAHLAAADIDAALDPVALTATARDMVRRALDARRRSRGVEHG